MKILGNVYCTNCDKHVLRCECPKLEKAAAPENKIVDANTGKNETSKKIVKK